MDIFITTEEKWQNQPLTCGALESLLQPFYDKLKTVDEIRNTLEDVRMSLDSLACQLIPDSEEDDVEPTDCAD